MKKVYIAGALNADAVGYLKNVHTMLKWAEKVRKAGFAVFVPALDYQFGMMFGDWEYKDYFDNSQPWLLASDAVFVCPNSEKSKGTQAEVKTARKAGIPVFYDISDLCALLEIGVLLKGVESEVTDIFIAWEQLMELLRGEK